jgi:hypothetical protein
LCLPSLQRLAGELIKDEQLFDERQLKPLPAQV